MDRISGALRNARAAIEHSQCGQVLQTAVTGAVRQLFDHEALAILLAVSQHSAADDAQKAEVAELRAVWESKCAHWRNEPPNRHNAEPVLPQSYRDWRSYLEAAVKLEGQ